LSCLLLNCCLKYLLADLATAFAISSYFKNSVNNKPRYIYWDTVSKLLPFRLTWKLVLLIDCSKMYNFRLIHSLYYNAESCVKINWNYADWFDVKSGLKQGCILSPLLFKLFINNLVDEMKKLNVGVKLYNEEICVLFLMTQVYKITNSYLPSHTPFWSL
jgi:hypothetical protein